MQLLQLSIGRLKAIAAGLQPLLGHLPVGWGLNLVDHGETIGHLPRQIQNRMHRLQQLNLKQRVTGIDAGGKPLRLRRPGLGLAPDFLRLGRHPLPKPPQLTRKGLGVEQVAPDRLCLRRAKAHCPAAHHGRRHPGPRQAHQGLWPRQNHQQSIAQGRAPQQ